MSTAQKQSLSSVLEMFDDIDTEAIGDMPTFDPFPSGVYRNLPLTGEMVTSGTKEGKDYWQRLELKFTMSEDTEIELAAEAIVPADGSQSQFTYTMAQSDKDTGKIVNVSMPHTATNSDGETYDSQGTLARLNKDFILSTGGKIAAKDLPTLMKVIATEPKVSVQFTLRQGKERDGVRPVYQNIVSLEYPE